MGIWGLQSFIDGKQWYEEVNIRDVAQEWRRTKTVEPVIAVDGAACARHIYGTADKFCGGQYKQFRESCRTFVQRFRDSGIRLVFFFDGIPVEEKMNAWANRRMYRLLQISQLFADFRARRLTKETKRKFYLTPEAVVPTARVIFCTELDCKVRVATEDCDNELAEYAAREDHCLGIISSDTDLLVHEGVPCLILFKHLKMTSSLNARRYNPADIASKLGLRREHLPVFASFVGNDIIIRSQLESLHDKLFSRYGKGTRVENVAKFVRDGPPEDVPALCAYAFDDQPNHLEDEVRASIDSYRRVNPVAEEPTGDGPWGELLRLAKERHVNCKMPAVVYAVMMRRRFRIGEVLEDLARQRPTGLVLRPMRARLYAVLLRERGPDSAEVTEMMPMGINDIREESVAAAQLPTSVLHPGLRALWQQEDVAGRDQRWRLFAWVTSPRVNLPALRSVWPAHLAVPAVALSYLRHDCNPAALGQTEAAVFAAVAVAVGDASASFLAGPDVERVNVRAVYLATLFVRTVLHVLDAAAACGLSFPTEKDCLLEAYFDGRYFHDVYAATMSQRLRDPRHYLQWRASYEAQFQQLVDAIESTN
ncbi:constitutive coactivator of peroxisome proliferator-activated receptor gamma-like [Schistocerca gregaria]|uniref:constitutive coactivator of peroxisome proliferator-activated receptor gamma-like n=1 Tax=Schistocerca gregaria TaxID=7010 RepID=UPI00211EE5E3|nr:constitutive coactivator of peroxisome proliferator-activated receptor gamma-like [Schistocerca gregaria]XP_049828535.1 constitutive coactivator of peroxisome proliferator-activated receptor gamma-like [Schistocerca gregaria]